VDEDVLIVGCGMITPVGLSAKETAASARARTARLTEIEWRDSRFKRFTVGLVPEDGLPMLHPDLESLPLSYRESRMLRLAEPALLEALEAVPKKASPVPVFVGLPELHTTLPIAEGEFLKRLAVQTGASLNLANSAAFSRGRASGFLALREGCARLSAGKAAFVLVGGVDTYVDLYILGTLDMQQRVRTEVNSDGFAPGEGAAFLLLTTAETALKHGLKALAKVVGTAVAKENGHIYSEEPYKAEGLSAAFEVLFEAAGKVPLVGCIYASFNGEHYWAKEFGVALLRNKPNFAPDYQMEHPAECFGDLGAAHGPVMLELAAFHLERNLPNRSMLVFASSDLGDRTAVLLSGR
jgi:3-oxoacyl-[acyl-carrier-protein] synthase I